MRRFSALLCLLAPSLALLAHAQNDSSDTTKLLALETAWNQAQVRRDTKALDSLVADQFVYTDTDGTMMNKNQFLADVKDPDFKATLVVNQEISVYNYPGAAVVTGTYHTKGTYKNKPVDHWGRFTDMWLFLNNKWQCVATHTNLIKK